MPKFVRDRLGHRINLLAILHNSGWLFADKIIRMGVGLFVGVWIARYLGPEQFGLWNYALAFTGLFGAFATLGLDGIVVRDLVKNPERQNVLLGSAFALKLIGGVITLLLALVAISLLRGGETLTLWLVGLSSAGFIFQSVNVVDFYFQSKVQSKYTVYAANAAFLIMTLVKIALLVTAAPLIAFAWAGLAEVVFTAAFLLLAYSINHHNIHEWRYESSVAKSLLKDSWPLIFAGLAVSLYMRIDQVMLGEILGPSDVGLYSVAVRLSEVWYVIPTIIVSSVMPAVMNGRKQSIELYSQRLQQLFDHLVKLAYLVAITMSFLANPLIHYLYGDSYSQAGAILAVHIWSAVFVFLGVATTPWTLAEKTMKYSLYQTLIGAVLNILLNFYMIPYYGVVGAALATALSQCISVWISNLFFKVNRPLFWMQTNSILMISSYKNIVNRLRL
jgi:PST family polysaccharide transporter